MAKDNSKSEREPVDYSAWLTKTGTDLQTRFADWLMDEDIVGYDPSGAKTKEAAFREGVRLATALRIPFQASPENQSATKAAKAKRAAEAEEADEKPAKPKKAKKSGDDEAPEPKAKRPKKVKDDEDEAPKKPKKAKKSEPDEDDEPKSKKLKKKRKAVAATDDDEAPF